MCSATPTIMALGCLMAESPGSLPLCYIIRAAVVAHPFPVDRLPRSRVINWSIRDIKCVAYALLSGGSGRHRDRYKHRKKMNCSDRKFLCTYRVCGKKQTLLLHAFCTPRSMLSSSHRTMGNRLACEFSVLE